MEVEYISKSEIINSRNWTMVDSNIITPNLQPIKTITHFLCDNRESKKIW